KAASCAVSSTCSWPTRTSVSWTVSGPRSPMGRRSRSSRRWPAARCHRTTQALNRDRPAADIGGVGEILVVDDDPDIRALIRLTLESYGHFVREAGNGEEALDSLEERAPEGMVLDLMMPKLDGYGVLRAMRQRELAPSTRVLILTCKTE